MIHQIGTDGVMFVRGEGDFQFSSHAIDAGDEHRLPHSVKIRRKQPTEPPNSSQHFRAVRFADKGLNSTLELVAKVNINAGASVSFLSLCHVERSRDISNYFPEYLPLNIRPGVIGSRHRRLEIPRLPSE